MDEAQFGYVLVQMSGHVQEKLRFQEKCLKRLHLIKGRKTTNLVRTQRRFNLVVKLIANK